MVLQCSFVVGSASLLLLVYRFTLLLRFFSSGASEIAVHVQVDQELLGWWLCERQLPCGGLNGRPEKKEDVRAHTKLLLDVLLPH